MKEKNKLIVNCFANCGLLSGYNDVRQTFQKHVTALIATGYTKRGDRFLTKTLLDVVSQNGGLMNRLCLNESSSKGSMVDALLSHLAEGSLHIVQAK